MKRKGLIIGIIVLIVLLILTGAAFAYIYFGTDLLKTNKELFAKYTVLAMSEEDGFFPKVLTDYGVKKETMAYENSGNFSVDIDPLYNDPSDEALQLIAQNINIASNTNIAFSGRVDKANRKAEENITINYSDTVNLPFKYKHEGDIYGIQADILMPNYIAVENNNLQEFARKLGVIDVSEIPNKIEEQVIESLEFSDEEVTHITQNYIMPMYNNLAEEKFTRTENADGSNNIILTLTNEEAKNILVQMLQTLSNDTTMLAKINNIVAEMYEENTETITSNDISALIENLNSQTAEEGNVVIALNVKDRITSGLSISTNTYDMSINKTQTDSNITFDIDVITKDSQSVESSQIGMQIIYNGINTNNVTESISVSTEIPEKINVDYLFNNNITFGNAINIEGFTENDVALNNYQSAQLQPFVVQALNIIAQTNSSQMQQIGYTEEFVNPMVLWFAAPTIYQSFEIIDRAIEAQNEVERQQEEQQEEQQELVVNFEHWINESLT